MADVPADLIDPAPAPSATPAPGAPSAPADLVDPAAVSGQSPTSDDSAARAVGTGVIKGVPFGRDIGAYANAALSYLPGNPNNPEIQGLPYAQRVAALQRRFDQQSELGAKEHPWLQTGASLATGAALPGGASVRGAMTYGGLQGLSEGIDEGDSIAGTAAKTALGTAGGGLGAGLVKGLVPIAGSATRAAVLDAANRLGVSMPRYSVSTVPLFRRAGMIGHSVPGMSTPLEEATTESVQGMGAAAEQAAAGATKETAGAAASTGLKDWIGPISKGDVAARYDAVANQINPNTKTPLSATLAVANEIASRRQAAGLSGMGGAVNHVTQAIQRGDGLTYNGIKDLRSSVGELMDSSVLPADMSGSELKQIYGALSNDLQRSAYNAGGQRGVDLHNAANDFAQQTAQRREQLVKLLGGPQAGNSDEAVFGAIQRAAGSSNSADISLLRQARSAVPPQSWDELSRGYVSTLGRDADGNFSPQRFLTDYGKMSDAGKDELFAQNGALRSNLDDLATVSRQWKSLYKYANPSGTAGHGVGVGMAIEGWRHPLKTLAAYMGGSAAGRFLATPAGAGAASNFVRAVGSGNLNMIRDAATRVSGAAGAQLGARVDPMALAAMAMQREEEHQGDSSGGNQPQ